MSLGHLIFLGFAAAAAVMCVASGTNPLAPLVDIVERGQQLTTSTVDAAGVVQESPDDLANAASVTLGRVVDRDPYSLSRMARSEDEHASTTAKVYKSHVVCNQAEALGWSPTELVTFHTTPSRAGHYGRQISGRVASELDPYENDLAAAEYALAQRAAGVDPTAGATNFVDVGGFGHQVGSTSFEATRESWAKEGKVPGTLPDAPAGLVFFWRGQVPSIAEALA